MCPGIGEGNAVGIKEHGVPNKHGRARPLGPDLEEGFRMSQGTPFPPQLLMCAAARSPCGHCYLYTWGDSFPLWRGLSPIKTNGSHVAEPKAFHFPDFLKIKCGEGKHMHCFYLGL